MRIVFYHYSLDLSPIRNAQIATTRGMENTLPHQISHGSVKEMVDEAYEWALKADRIDKTT